MNISQLKRFKIDDDIIVDAVKNLVYRDGEEIPVSPKGIQILLFLIAKKGELATYQEFESELWHGYNSQTSLYQQVASLRRSLGDSSTRPKYIKTISKQGYAFVGRYEPLEGSKVTGGKPVGVRSRAALIAAAVFVSVCIVGALAVLLQWTGSDEQTLAVETNLPEQVNAPLFIKSFAGEVDLPRAVIGLELPVATNDAEVLGVVNTLLFITKFHLETQSEFHIAILPAATVRDDWSILQQHFAEAGGLEFVYQPFIEHREQGVFYGVKKKRGKNAEPESVIELQASDLTQLRIDHFETQLISVLQEAQLHIQSEAQFKNNTHWQPFSALIQFPQNVFVPGEVFDQFYDGFVALNREAQENLVILSAAWDIIFATLDQQNIYNTSPVISTLLSMTEIVDKKMPGYFKSYHAKAEYYCRLLNYEKCKEELVEAYKRKPFDYGIIGNVRFYLIEFDKPTLLIDWINHVANPFSPGVYSFYRNSLLKQLQLSDAEKLAKSFSQWNSNRNNWYVVSQTKVTAEDLQRFNHWYKTQLQNDSRHKISKYNAYMLLNANFHQEASRLYLQGLEQQPYFDLLIIELLAGIWSESPDLEKWHETKQKAEDRREFQNALDKLYLAYFDMYFNNTRGARGYIEEIFPELTSDDILITQDNFRYAVYFNEAIKDIGDHRRSVSVDFALNSFLQQHPNLNRTASFGLADVEFYALTGRQQLAAERLEKAVLEEHWLPNAFWLWPPLEANPFLRGLKSTVEFQNAQQYIQKTYDALCLTDC
ncbi:hypothetical protein TDB9533_01738 [Thalassocella blandensis]|nr:hypothetical protein TDB9533_01738 [Thalassocella blandensis]